MDPQKPTGSITEHLSPYEASVCEAVVNIRANRSAKHSLAHPVHWDTGDYLKRQQAEAARRLTDYKSGATQPAIEYPPCFGPVEIFFVEQLHTVNGWGHLEEFVGLMAEAMPKEPIEDVSGLIKLINDEVIPAMAEKYN